MGKVLEIVQPKMWKEDLVDFLLGKQIAGTSLRTIEDYYCSSILRSRILRSRFLRSIDSGNVCVTIENASGRGAAWQAHSFGVRVVGRSNRLAPTIL